MIDKNSDSLEVNSKEYKLEGSKMKILVQTQKTVLTSRHTR